MRSLKLVAVLIVSCLMVGCVVVPVGSRPVAVPGGATTYNPIENGARLNRAISGTSGCDESTSSVVVDNTVTSGHRTTVVQQTPGGFGFYGPGFRAGRRGGFHHGSYGGVYHPFGGTQETTIVDSGARRTERCIPKPVTSREVPAAASQEKQGNSPRFDPNKLQIITQPLETSPAPQ